MNLWIPKWLLSLRRSIVFVGGKFVVHFTIGIYLTPSQAGRF